MNAEARTGEEMILEEAQPNLFGSTTNHEEVAEILPVVEEPGPENLIPNPDTALTKTLPEMPIASTEAPLEKSTTKVLESTGGEPEMDDEAKRNFLFAGTSLATDATPEMLNEHVGDKAPKEDLEDLASEVLIFEDPVLKT